MSPPVEFHVSLLGITWVFRGFYAITALCEAMDDICSERIDGHHGEPQPELLLPSPIPEAAPLRPEDTPDPAPTWTGEVASSGS